MKLPLHLLAGALLLSAATASAKLPLIIVNGRNNHDWKATTESLRATLDGTGLFDVSVSTAPEDKVLPLPRPKVEDAAYLEAKQRHDELVKSLAPEQDAAWAKWQPDFSKYVAVVLDYNGPTWPEPMRKAFVDYVRGGGGVLLIHGANNSFPEWGEFNEMIGLGWRNAGFGVALTIDPATGGAVECCPGEASSAGAKHAFVVTTRQPGHPVLRGFPAEWLHATDELYHHMRGPAQGVTILASAYSDPQQRGSGRHEPVLWETAFGKGRVLTCSLGHLWPGDKDRSAVQCVGFQTLVARGAEYVATGKVTLDVPADFPTKDKPLIVEPAAVKWSAEKR